MTNLRAIIEDEITRTGIMPFARFMELALYCPNFGYYERLEGTPGRGGDFYTSVSVGSLFGELLAWQFAEWLAGMPGQNRQIVEAGAHDGQLAHDVLNWLRGNRPELLASLEYWILEPSARRRQSQQERLAEFGKTVKWFAGWEAVPASGVDGVIFSNELLDAMPVHRLGWDATAKVWLEWGVGVKGGQFVWEKAAPSAECGVRSAELLKVPAELLAVLPDGFTTEVCPGAMEWWRRAAGALRRGKLLTFDYGLTVEEFFTPERRNGTLRAYHRHRQSDDLLAQPGEQDLTAQVNFTAVREAGEEADLKTEGLSSQAQFLTAVVQRMSATTDVSTWLTSRSREFQTLTHPAHLGAKFRALVQGC